MMKRSSRDAKLGTSTAGLDETSPVAIMFREYQQQLDDKHDRHERLVKLSRDITIESKRCIFVLQRAARPGERDKALSEAEQKLAKLRQSKWQQVAKELHGHDPYQYLRAYSAGLQEYIEAVSLYHYVQHGTLVALKDVQEQLTFTVVVTPSDDKQITASCNTQDAGEPAADVQADPTTVTVHIPPIEYILGVADLTGEVMRMTISSVSTGELEMTRQYCGFIRTIYDSFVALGNISRELTRKVSTLRQSLHKVETACYTLQVRGSEIPKHMLAAVFTDTKDAERGYVADEG